MFLSPPFLELEPYNAFLLLDPGKRQDRHLLTAIGIGGREELWVRFPFSGGF